MPKKKNRKITEAVRKAVAGTLNREVEVEVERRDAGRWGVTLLHGKERSLQIGLEDWEMASMVQVPLIPAHRRGIFLRHYRMLVGE
jgi:hypothetical protein